ncbi:MAG: recombinase family protein [Bacteroidales bacterium]|nr:recombinase family protein [Bacteroidales bacterium]
MEPKAYSYKRFSTPEQEKGDSLRRQTEFLDQIAKELNLPLDNSIHLTDLGVSGWTGDNRTKGALGHFLKLIENGEIAVGSCLIIEHLDRLTREGMLQAIHLLTGILLKGIDLYTVMDRRHFTKEEYNLADLIISATTLQHGHEESEKKSIRLKKAWENKRNNISDQFKLTSKCPVWLKPIREQISPTRYKVTGYEKIKSAVDVINLIFDMKLKGKGSERIARELNQSEVWCPPGKKGKSSSWRASYVSKILYNNRTVLGEFQPYKKEKGKHSKRIPVGDPISNYYPAIIKEEKFNRVQAHISEHSDISKRNLGRSDKVSNLFSHLAKCYHCQYPMQFIDKSNGWTYLVCDKKLRKVDGGCNAINIRYNVIEDVILKYCVGLDINDILPSDKPRLSELRQLQNRESSIKGEIVGYQKKIDRLKFAIETTENKDVIKNITHNIDQHIENVKTLTEEKKIVQSKIETLSQAPRIFHEQLKDVQELIGIMDKLKQGDNYSEYVSLRLNLRTQLRRLIQELSLFDDTIGILFFSGQRRFLKINNDKSVTVLDFTFRPRPVSDYTKNI